MNDRQSLEEYRKRVIRVAKYSGITLMILSLGSLSSYKSFFLGLTLGILISLLNYIYTAWKVNRIGEIAIKPNAHRKRKFITSGTTTRMATSLLAAMLAFRYPESFYLFSTLFGLFVVQIIAVVDGIIHT